MSKGKTLSGSQIFVDALIQEGVDILYGYPGGVLIPIYDALYDCKEIDVVLTRHEQGAAHAADGYARATGKVGVCMGTSGPGATNLVTGIATAYLDSIPMVAISGQVASPLLGTDAFQEADMVGITRPITKHNFLVTKVEDLAPTLKKAFHIASTGRPGPVLVDITKDATTAMLENYEYPQEVSVRTYKPTLEGNPRQIAKAVKAIKRAKRPILYGGGGLILSGAEKEFKELAEKTNMPTTTTLMGLGAFPGTHKQFLGMPGMHGSVVANMTLQSSDLIVSVGARFDDRVTGNVAKFAPDAEIVHIDIDPASISKIIDVDIPVVGDAKTILAELNKTVKGGDYSDWWKQVEEWRGGDVNFSFKDSDDVIKPQSVIKALYEETKGDAYIVTDVGQHQMWTAQYYLFNEPHRFLTSGGLGTMGFGLPAAMGASMATGKPAWNISGDGGIQMNIQELATIKINKVAAKTIVLNNEYLGMVRQWQDLFYDKRYSSVCLTANAKCDGCGDEPNCDIRNEYTPNFVKLAEAYGIPARRITKPSELKDAIKWANELEGACFLEVMVDPEENVFPMVPAGAALSEVIAEA